MKIRSWFVVVIVLFTAARFAFAVETENLLKIKFALAESSEGSFSAAPTLVIANGETARLQFPLAKALMDYSFRPTIDGNMVRMTIASHCQDANGHEIPSTLCKVYTLPFDSEVRMQDGDHFLSVIVSRSPKKNT